MSASTGGHVAVAVRPGAAGARRGIREVLLLGALYAAYSGARMLADADIGAAQRRAQSLLGFERSLGIDVESWLNHAVTGIASLAIGMCFWYAALHYIVTPLVLRWLYVRHPDRYPTARNALVIGSALGLIGYVLIPMAPPRLMPNGYIDTLTRYADVGWWSSHASAPVGLGHLTNELAAMPSLHVGWAFWVAWAVYQVAGRTLRVAGIAYAGVTAVVVIATGNHWVLDGAAGIAVIMLGIVVAGRLRARAAENTSSRSGTRSGPAQRRPESGTGRIRRRIAPGPRRNPSTAVAHVRAPVTTRPSGRAGGPGSHSVAQRAGLRAVGVDGDARDGAVLRPPVGLARLQHEHVDRRVGRDVPEDGLEAPVASG